MDRKLILLFLGSVLICVYVAVDWTSVERRFVRFELEWGLRSPTIVAGPKAGQGDSALVQQVKMQYFSDRQKSPQGGYEANAGRYGVGYYNRASRHLGSESDYNAGSGLTLERPDGGKRGGQGAPHPSILETQAAANGVYCEGYELGHQFRVGKSGAVSDSQLAKDALVTLDGRYPRWNSLPELRAAFISGFTDGYRNRKADPARR